MIKRMYVELDDGSTLDVLGSQLVDFSISTGVDPVRGAELGTIVEAGPAWLEINARCKPGERLAWVTPLPGDEDSTGAREGGR